MTLRAAASDSASNTTRPKVPSSASWVRPEEQDPTRREQAFEVGDVLLQHARLGVGGALGQHLQALGAQQVEVLTALAHGAPSAPSRTPACPMAAS